MPGKDVVSLPGGSHRFEGFETTSTYRPDWLRLSDEHHDKDHQTTARSNVCARTSCSATPCSDIS